MRVGSGEFIYEFIPSWGKLPVGYEFGSVPNGAVDIRGRVYIFSRTSHPIMIFDADGNFIKSWGEGVFSRPHDAFIGPDESIYCIDDLDHTVRKCTYDGEIMMTLGAKNKPSDTGYDGENLYSIKQSAGPFNRPTSLAIGLHGELYVSDGYGNARVHKFAPDGKLIKSWGAPGTGPGEFSLPHTICVAKNGTVYVADRQNYRIQLFTPDGEFIEEWTDFHRPTGMYIGQDDLLYITELKCDNPRVPHPLPPRFNILTLEGELLARWGTDDLEKTGNFYAPHGLWGDQKGNIYVGELTADSETPPRPAGYPSVHKMVRV